MSARWLTQLRYQLSDEKRKVCHGRRIYIVKGVSKWMGWSLAIPSKFCLCAFKNIYISLNCSTTPTTLFYYVEGMWAVSIGPVQPFWRFLRIKEQMNILWLCRPNIMPQWKIISESNRVKGA